MNLLEVTALFVIVLLVLCYCGMICITGITWCNGCSERFTNEQVPGLLAAAKRYYDSAQMGGPGVTMNPISVVREVAPNLYEIKYEVVQPTKMPWAPTQETSRFVYDGKGNAVQLVERMAFS